jgi:hypothetical protein
MPRHWIIGSCYLLIAALNIYRTGVASPNWIPWLFLAAGILSLQYTPAGQSGKKGGAIILSNRNKTSLAATILGVVMLVGLAIFYNRR